jgi:hypothetical protein
MDMPGAEAHESESLPLPRSRWLVVIAVVAGAFAVAGVIARQQLGDAVPNSDYHVSIAAGVQPHMTADRAAAIATRYLNDQTGELAAAELHRPPRIVSASALAARDARTLEPAIPDDRVAERPDRLVWVVEVTGDLLNFHVLAWSNGEFPGPSGTIVIDDATQVILGVYPDGGPP